MGDESHGIESGKVHLKQIQETCPNSELQKNAK